MRWPCSNGTGSWARSPAAARVHWPPPPCARAVRWPIPTCSSPWHELADELRPDGESNVWPPLNDPSTLLALIDQPPPVRLEGTDLVHVAALAGDLDALRDHLLDGRSACPRWGEAALATSPLDGLRGALLRALEPDGRLRDEASPRLGPFSGRPRRRSSRPRSEVNEAMMRARSATWTTADEVTFAAIASACRCARATAAASTASFMTARRPGLRSSSSRPASFAWPTNSTSLRLEIAAEEARILFELNRAVEQAAPALRDAASLMLLVDEVRAGLLKRAVRGRRVRLDEAGSARIDGGRHPLLMAALGDGDLVTGRPLVVPLDLEIPDGCRVLVIGGPNAGGKSVALKTVGVLCLLAQCGWDVPAREDTVLPLVSRLLVDLGDDQSIAESLQFILGAHAAHLGEFLAVAAPGTLVLSDEIGSGTDPQEGTALAFAALERLDTQGALVLASTHFGLLKAAVHDHPQMQNAAMDFDERDLAPALHVPRGG